MAKEKIRLDQALVARGLSETREKARATIMSGIVYVNDQKESKPGTFVTGDDRLEIRGKTLAYVSRGGLKLEKALDVFSIDPAGKEVIDVGASTGGFTDCLLKRGAVHVWSVDVGYGQLAWSLREDPRVTVMERTNIRYVTPEEIGRPLDLAVIDVSFISLRLVLPPVKALLKETGEIACLIKPQFEAGREKVGKKGVVRDPVVHKEVLEAFVKTAAAAGLTVRNLDFSPITGPEGNIEYLGHLSVEPAAAEPVDLDRLVQLSHAAHDTRKNQGEVEP